MKLRFLKKLDGTKVLQIKEEGCLWKDLPMVQEESPSIKEVLYKELRTYEAMTCEIPAGLALGFDDYAKLKSEMLDFRNTGGFFSDSSSMTFCGVPVTKFEHKAKGIYFLKEAK